MYNVFRAETEIYNFVFFQEFYLNHTVIPSTTYHFRLHSLPLPDPVFEQAGGEGSKTRSFKTSFEGKQLSVSLSV